MKRNILKDESNFCSAYHTLYIKKQINTDTPDVKKYCVVEHAWRLGRWILGSIVIITWFIVNTLPAVLIAFTVLGIYEQLHGVICHLIEKALHYPEQHNDWE